MPSKKFVFLTVSVPRRIYDLVIRFFTHLCLVFRFLKVDMSQESQDVILEAWNQILQKQGDMGLVLMYTGAFGEQAVDKTAAYLARTLAFPLIVLLIADGFLPKTCPVVSAGLVGWPHCANAR